MIQVNGAWKCPYFALCIIGQISKNASHSCPLRYAYDATWKHRVYKFGNKALLFYCTLLKTCQVHKSVQMYKILIQRNDIYSSLFCRNKTRKDIYALIIRTVNCEKIWEIQFWHAWVESDVCKQSFLIQTRTVEHVDKYFFTSYNWKHFGGISFTIVDHRLSVCAQILWYIWCSWFYSFN